MYELNKHFIIFNSSYISYIFIHSMEEYAKTTYKNYFFTILCLVSYIWNCSFFIKYIKFNYLK